MSELVIVESPAKAKTIQKYLGTGFEVVASMGHVRDLPKSKLSVDIEHDFEPTYIEMKGKEDVIRDLKARAKKSDRVWLATDPDREGEAISWHLAQLLGLDIQQNNRVEFNEITKTGVQTGMSHPHKIDLDLVNAQQARRILDRIVGYQLSPFLWRKIRRGLSAGRVQSVAVRLVVDRENEIRAFQPREYWSIDAKLTAKSSRKVFAAHLTEVDGKKAELATGAETDEILKSLEDAQFVVKSVKKRVTSRQPAPPFITSTLQQEASRRMGFQARRTMKTAQELYEGVELPTLGAVGLITYMRTDSLRISDEAKAAAAEYIRGAYGKQYLPATPRNFKTKKGAQDAHEAIRPTMPDLTPDQVKDSLTTDQYKLYKLIWERFIASQMANCQLDTMSADITANNCLFRASGYSVKFDGFTKLYVEAKDSKGDEEDNKELPPLNEGDPLKVKAIAGNQHFTQPPSRYTEATLIKALEENGIGRPSTYAATVSTILSRMYVERDGKQLRPTSLGEVTTELMKDQFKQIVDVKFTADMESDLDGVEQGKTDWVESLRKFYDNFEKTLANAEKAMDGKRLRVPDEETDEICELCGKPMVIKIGRFGKFLACSGFPDCRNTKKIVTPTKGFCPLCGKKIILKKSKKGRSFYGCEGYPDCTFMTWSTPVEDRCPKCQNTLFKKGGRAGKLVCEKPDCGYERPL
ncbi:MAG TPA: type I DNA topoisomerase [Ruminococcus sp.]|nr:type I DNA topoisomerase [Ruminococcus sp.]